MQLLGNLTGKNGEREGKNKGSRVTEERARRGSAWRKKKHSPLEKNSSKRGGGLRRRRQRLRLQDLARPEKREKARGRREALLAAGDYVEKRKQSPFPRLEKRVR